MTRIAIAIFTVALGGMGMVVTSSAAWAQTDAACSVEFTATFSPGLTLLPSSGTVSSQGEPGTITCQGQINGQQVTGSGPFSFQASYGAGALGLGDTCLGGAGSGVYTGTVQTAGGAVRLSEQVSFTYRSTSLTTGEGEVQGNGTRGTFTFGVVAGDCILTPLTKFAVDVNATVRTSQLFPVVGAPAPAPSAPPAPLPAVGVGAPSPGGALPATGGDERWTAGLVLLVLGALLFRVVRRRDPVS